MINLSTRVHKPGRRHTPQPRCDFCTRFLSWEEVRTSAVAWTPYGGPEDIDPPDEEYAHAACWDADDGSHRALVRRISWIGPTRPGGPA